MSSSEESESESQKIRNELLRQAKQKRLDKIRQRAPQVNFISNPSSSSEDEIRILSQPIIENVSSSDSIPLVPRLKADKETRRKKRRRNRIMLLSDDSSEDESLKSPKIIIPINSGSSTSAQLDQAQQIQVVNDTTKPRAAPKLQKQKKISVRSSTVNTASSPFILPALSSAGNDVDDFWDDVPTTPIPAPNQSQPKRIKKVSSPGVSSRRTSSSSTCSSSSNSSSHSSEKRKMVGPGGRNKRRTSDASPTAEDETDFILYPELVDPPFCDPNALPLELRSVPTMQCDSKVGQVPQAISRYLKNYQRAGVEFMWGLVGRRGGGLLADDMGLGKTVQVAALLAALFEKTGTFADRKDLRRKKRAGIPGSCVLVVAPSSVMDNWRRELQKWGHFSVLKMESGSNEEDTRASLARDAAQGRIEVLLVTQPMLPKVVDLLEPARFSLLVIDECHLMANPKKSRYEALEKLVPNCACRIGLTGTPMSNKYEELFYTLHLLDKGCLGTWSDFNEFYARPIKRGATSSAQKAALSLGKRRQAILNQTIAPLVLRRTKEQVLQDVLVGKVDQVVFCKLSPLQIELYERMLALPDFENLRRHSELCLCGSMQERGKCCHRAPYTVSAGRTMFDDTTIDERAVVWRTMHPDGEPCPRCPHCVGFAALSKLQKVVNHPSLLLVDPRESSADKRAENLKFAKEVFTPTMLQAIHPAEYGEAAFYRSANLLDLSDTKVCGKLFILEKLLTAFERAREKCLVFSWSTQTLNVIEALCHTRGWNCTRLDGSTPTSSRQKLVDEFNKSFSSFVFLCSTRAGGVGINLQSASKVIVFDVNWNPAYDQQAQDRAYRIGQTKQVSVFRLVSEGTIEELMYMRQLYKTALTAGALDGEQRERLFEAIEGEKKGELYGLSNLMRFDLGGHLNRTRNQKKAKTAALKRDLSDEDEDEDRTLLPGGVEVFEAEALVEEVRDAAPALCFPHLTMGAHSEMHGSYLRKVALDTQGEAVAEFEDELDEIAKVEQKTSRSATSSNCCVPSVPARNLPFNQMKQKSPPQPKGGAPKNKFSLYIPKYVGKN